MKTRIISGLVGVALAVIVLLLHKTFVFPLVLAALICIALYELYQAGDCLKSCPISVCAGFVMGVLTPFMQFYGNSAARVGITFLCVVAMFIEMVLFHHRVKYEKSFFVIAVTVLVTTSLSMLALLMQAGDFGLIYVLLALCSAWIADTGAYFTGTFLGKHKLCPEISPKKTIEGFFGGVVADVIFMVILGLIYAGLSDYHVHLLWLIFAAMLCSVVSVLGDLSASILKRQVDIKDFGNIMPGHGGVMDRFDSVLFTVPAFYTLVCMYPIFYM